MAKPGTAQAVILIALCCLQPLLPGPSAPRAQGIDRKGTGASARYVEAIVHCYEGAFSLRDANTIEWNDGTIQRIDDGEAKDFEAKLARADIDDQFSIPYPRGPLKGAPAYNEDPGRIRNTAFFKKLYGGSAAEVEAALKPLTWMPGVFDKQILFNTRHGAWESLNEVSRELAALDSRFHVYLDNISGTYLWRPIQGTDRLSAHSFGIAIDINVAYSYYWLWDKQYEYRNKIPEEIVAIFEKHGFIWGGKWYHYDTMHFEYRPELLW
jgi:peptidoglycan L-alanyl-D-glutamate endopeptidase CwlK